MKTLVIGRGGLIGSSLENALFKRFGHKQVQQKIHWKDPSRALVALSGIVQRFFSENTNESWVIAWCAGQGSFASKNDETMGLCPKQDSINLNFLVSTTFK